MALSAFDLRKDIDRQLEQIRLDWPSTSDTLSRPVRDVLRYLHAHVFDAGLNVSVARLQCGLRDNNVSSLFRKEVGCFIKEYIDTLRMEAARRLLKDERLSVFEIGQSVGYSYPQTFYRVYRRRFGGAPASQRVALDPAVSPEP